MRVHLYKLFSGFRFILLMASRVLVWILNSSWNWKTKMVAIMNRSNGFPSEGGYEYTMRQTINVNYHQIWEKCNQTINKESIYKPSTDVVEVIDALRRAKIIKADIYSPPTASAYMWMLILEGEQQVLFKPAFTLNTDTCRRFRVSTLDQRNTLQKKAHNRLTKKIRLITDKQFIAIYNFSGYSILHFLRNTMVKESVECVSGCEHPEYEVAGFALNRILQLGNMPYATGRRVSWDKEIASVATEALRTSVTVQEGGDVCITWSCYLKRTSRYCFEKGVIRGAVIYWISHGTVVQRVTVKRSSHHEFHFLGGFLEIFAPILPGNRTFCDRVKTMEPYKSNSFSFGYILDMAVIDFLMLNYDGGKHTYIVNRNERIYLNILIDYGLSSCDREDPVLLAPIYQCCNIREKLYKGLLKYSANLTEVFDDATKDDPLYPLLLPRDITAMQQRLNTIIAIVQICLKKYGETGVLV